MAKSKSKVMGRPKLAINWEICENLCKIQCTHEEIAQTLNVSIETLNRACKRENGCTFGEFNKRYKFTGKSSLRRAQMKSALKGNPALLIWTGKQYLNQSDKAEVEIGVPTLIKRVDGKEALLLTSKEKGEEEEDD